MPVGDSFLIRDGILCPFFPFSLGSLSNLILCVAMVSVSSYVSGRHRFLGHLSLLALKIFSTVPEVED